MAEAESLFRETRELSRKHPEIIERAEKAVEAEPKNGHLWHALGESLFDSGEWQAAIAAFEQCNQLGGSAWQWFFLAMAHWQLDNQAEAHKWFYRSISWMDEVQDSRLSERQAEAAGLLRLPNPEERSRKASTYFKQGNAYQQQGEMDKAKGAYGQAISHYETLVADFPRVPAYRRKLVDLLARTDRQQEVDKVYRQAGSAIREELVDLGMKCPFDLGGRAVERDVCPAACDFGDGETLPAQPGCNLSHVVAAESEPLGILFRREPLVKAGRAQFLLLRQQDVECALLFGGTLKDEFDPFHPDRRVRPAYI